MATPKDKDTKRNTSEKPISLHPIPLDDALRDLLATKAPPKDDKKRGKTKKPHTST